MISPNVEGTGDPSYYLKEMFASHTTMMGWGPNDKFGRIFHNMSIGDYVICAKGANKNKEVFFAGKLKSETSKEWPYTRQLAGFVELANEPIQFSNKNAYGDAPRIPAIYELKPGNEADRAICDIIKQKVDFMITIEKVNELKDTLVSNFNLILTGAPGTGKTYRAQKIAEAMDATFDNGRLGFVQFHPSYDYTDFVEGLRPVKDDKGNIGFERKDGIFLDFCRRALADPEHEYVFVIDEINRGELSKILGELFFAIDPGYRGKCGSVQTQYSNLWPEFAKSHHKDDFDKTGRFYIPKNVYIIGTMNDIDRSVEAMDFAMRRRFTFKEITANDSEVILDSVQNWPEGTSKDELAKKMGALNAVIEKTEALGSAFQLGGAYFKKIEQCATYDDLWRNYLRDILNEYLRGMPEGQKQELLHQMKAAYDSSQTDGYDD